MAALVDLASLRDEVASNGGDPSTVDSLCPADLVVDNFAQVDFSHIKTQVKEHKHKEGQRSQRPYSQPPPGKNFLLLVEFFKDTPKQAFLDILKKTQAEKTQV